MTIQQRRLFDRIQEIRGVIRNKKKYESMVVDIYNTGSKNMIDEVSNRKRFGLEFIWRLCVYLNHKEQDVFLKEFNESIIKNKQTALHIISLITAKII